MTNIELTRDGSRLIIVVDLAAEGVPSASGKTVVIGSTRGNQDVPGTKGVRIGLNVYGYEGYLIDAGSKPVGIRRTA